MRGGFPKLRGGEGIVIIRVIAVTAVINLVEGGRREEEVCL